MNISKSWTLYYWRCLIAWWHGLMYSSSYVKTIISVEVSFQLLRVLSLLFLAPDLYCDKRFCRTLGIDYDHVPVCTPARLLFQIRRFSLCLPQIYTWKSKVKNFNQNVESLRQIMWTKCWKFKAENFKHNVSTEFESLNPDVIA